MSRVVLHDTICARGHVTVDVVCERGVDQRPIFPPCAHTTDTGAGDGSVQGCRAETRAYYGARAAAPEGMSSAAYAGVFHPFTHDGVYYATREEWTQYKKDVAANLLDDVAEAPPLSRAERIRVADEARHRGYLARKKEGFDDRDWQRYKEEQRRKKALGG